MSLEQKIEHKDFIATYTNVYPEGFCNHLINEFERIAATGAGSDRSGSEGAPRHIKNDYQLMLRLKPHNPESFNGNDSMEMFFKGLQACYDEYCSQYSVLGDGRIRSTLMKIQRTSPGGGYHVWHGEQGSEYPSRVLVYMLYLNTLPEESAGETEFLYQQKRISPVENTVVLWPASFTHAHRGNTVFGEENKYIVTGWFDYD
jgi:hypothetical protein